MAVPMAGVPAMGQSSLGYGTPQILMVRSPLVTSREPSGENAMLGNTVGPWLPTMGSGD
jgi:hypothetical protein